MASCCPTLPSPRRGVGGLEAVAATLKSFGRSSRDLLGELIPGIFPRRGLIGVSVRVAKLRTEALTTRGIK